MNRGVIQLLCAGTGRESRTISGPERRRNATTWSRRSRQEAKMGAGQNGTGAQSSFGLRERVSEIDTRKERPLEGGADQEEREKQAT